MLKEKVWGGTKLSSLFQKKGNGKISESWEISAFAENLSEVANGSLREKHSQFYKEQLAVEKCKKKFKHTFPLLFKFIDAKEDLSVQVHPDDIFAKKRHNSFGKTEMWYILDVEKDGRLILRFNENIV